MLKEIFKTIPSYPNYEISNYGTVRTFYDKRFKTKTEKPRILKHHKNYGYLHVSIVKNTGEYIFPLVHRLVAETFIRPVLEFEIVHHKDHNKKNNNVENLEIMSRQQNTKEGMISGFNTAPFESKGKNKRFTMDEVEKIRKLNSEGISYTKLCKIFDRNITSIYHIIHHNSFTGIPVNKVLKNSTVEEIKNDYKNGNSIEDIMEKFQISKYSVDNIISGKSYKKKLKKSEKFINENKTL